MEPVDVSFKLNIDLDICDFSELNYLITTQIGNFGEMERCKRDSNMVEKFETDIDILRNERSIARKISPFASLITNPSLKSNRFKFLLIPPALGWIVFNWTREHFGRENPFDYYQKNYQIEQLIEFLQYFFTFNLMKINL